MSRKDLSKGKTKEVLERLATFSNKVADYLDEITVQQGSLENNDAKLQKGSINNEEHKKEQARVRASTLYYIEKIENAIREHFPDLRLPLTQVSLHEQIIISTHGKFSDITPYINGDSAVFFKATRIGDDRQVMLRVFKQSPYEDDEPEDFFVDKEKFTKIRERNIIRIEHIENQTYPQYLVLDYINGISLDKLMRSQLPLSPTLAINIMLDIAKALSYLSTIQIIHGRVRPSKVLIDNELKPVISPFEGYKRRNFEGQSLEFISKELKYIAPELVSGAQKNHSVQSDQFSFGVVGLEMLIGHNPFMPVEDGSLSIRQILENRAQFFAKLPSFLHQEIGKLPVDDRSKEDLIELFSTLLAKLPEEGKGKGRYKKMSDIVDAIEEIRIREEKVVKQVRKSYHRCCICVENFTDVFYQELLLNPAIKNYFDKYHKHLRQHNKDVNIEKLRRTRRKMLRTTIHLLMADSPEHFYTKLIKKMPQHHGISTEHYIFYFDTIQKLVQNNDPDWDEDVATAWTIVRNQAIERFK